MPFISKEQVQQKNIKLKEICKKYNIKAKFSGSNSSTLVCKITEGCIDFFSNAINYKQTTSSDIATIQNLMRCKEAMYMQVNHYYLQENFCGVALDCLQEIYQLMKEGYWDDSDIMTDYFSCSWYNRICIGGNKPYKLI